MAVTRIEDLEVDDASPGQRHAGGGEGASAVRAGGLEQAPARAGHSGQDVDHPVAVGGPGTAEVLQAAGDLEMVAVVDAARAHVKGRNPAPAYRRVRQLARESGEG